MAAAPATSASGTAREQCGVCSSDILAFCTTTIIYIKNIIRIPKVVNNIIIISPKTTVRRDTGRPRYKNAILEVGREVGNVH